MRARRYVSIAFTVLAVAACNVPVDGPDASERDAAIVAVDSVDAAEAHEGDATTADAFDAAPDSAADASNVDAPTVDHADAAADHHDAAAGDACASVGDRFGLLADCTRDKLQWPFAVDSIWNTPIGSNATYVAAGITRNSAPGYPTRFAQDQDIIIMRPTAPATQVFYSSAAWTGANRCMPTGSTPRLVTTLPIPSDYVLPNNGENNSAAVLRADGHTLGQNEPLTRCTAGGSATTDAWTPDQDIYGPGIVGAHGGSSLSAIGGTIRLGEFPSGRLHHALKVNLWAHQYSHCCSPIWPATSVDGYASSTTYGGTNPALGPGALLALLPAFDVAALRTVPGRIIAQAMKDYGAYFVDDTAWNAWAMETEQGPAGRVVDEFQRTYGFAMNPSSDTDPFMLDMVDVFSALHIVTNNSASHVGGGGTPRVSLAPPIGN